MSVETEFEFASDKLERRERELGEREQRVEKRESSLDAYVASAQGELTPPRSRPPQRLSRLARAAGRGQPMISVAWRLTMLPFLSWMSK